MDPTHWVAPPGVRSVMADWFAAVSVIEEDCLLDFSPFEGMAAPRDARLPHERVLDDHGGIVATAELLSAGVDEMSIRFLLRRKRLVRLRKGWYGRPDLPRDGARAWRIGGPLGCVSALVHHDIVDRAALRVDDGLHVVVRQNTSRRPSELTIATWPFEDETSPPPVLHWSSRDIRSGTRIAVSVEVALEQARHCRPLLAARAGSRREHQQRTATTP
ncbi:type IV toxin-antitoxin system AbiEi family antitoxin domain-containing protein [Microcella alkalica]|uniref:AbiEi antitoxin N-terminal domain-containing protein n=1 Tax=Microcella alkalica TaxID=355930 RepID=A0A839E8U2_9MICO|nr:type IV toxin-antitoxin system AbiEi family antitoxin domain-containing protein [Microcella alkalica]MBA8846842.1 hypothetical protein [Microcella alkalica]